MRLGWREAGLVLAGTALSIWFNASLSLNVDVSWFYYVAQRVFGGAVLYRDLIEPNAPFASLSMMPAALLAAATSLSAFHAIIAYVSALGLLSYAASARLLADYGLPAGRGHLLKLSLFAGMFFLPGALFGEREHLFCILTLPYCLATALRGREVGRLLALRCVAGFAAGLAVNLKPPFALIVAAAELTSLVMAGRASLFASEQIGLGISAVLSALAYPLLFPLYATAVLPWVVDLYGAFADTATTVRKAIPWGLSVVTAFLLWGRDANKPLERLRRLSLGVAGAALLVFAVQDKGWDYQLFIATFWLAIMAALAVQVSIGRPWRVAAAALLAFGLVLRAGVLFEAPDYVDTHFANVRRLIEASPGSFVVLTPAGSPGYPLTVETGHLWASRYACLVMLPGLVAAEASGKPSRWEAPFRDAMAADFARYQPPLVFVQTDQLPGLPPHFDVLGWLMRDPRFSAQWSAYRQDGVADRFFAVFRRK